MTLFSWLVNKGQEYRTSSFRSIIMNGTSVILIEVLRCFIGSYRWAPLHNSCLATTTSVHILSSSTFINHRATRS